jgi:hypothetical protein
MPNIVYDVVTDLPPDRLNAVGLEVFRMWSEFALGLTDIGGLMIKHPTGRYASSLRMRTTPTVVTVMADESKAAEARWLEEGHGRIDMLQHLTAGRSYPMHRGGVGRKLQTRRKVKGGYIWAVSAGRNLSGYVKVPHERPNRMNTSGTGPAWTIPSMPAYAPAHIMAQLIAAKYRKGAYA